MTQAYICDANRTPIGSYGDALAGVRTDDLGAVPLCALLARTPSLDPAQVDEVFLSPSYS
jgi:acetyl-CoA acetyltransferase